ncbi:hypothetical protein Tco_0223524 [Tanacetum coccineum]
MTSGQLSSGLAYLCSVARYNNLKNHLKNCSGCSSTSSSSDSNGNYNNSRHNTDTNNCILRAQATDLSNTSQDVDELEIQEHVQHQTTTIADNVPNAMFMQIRL